MTMMPAEHSREQYEIATRALDGRSFDWEGDDSAVTVAVHAAWEAGYWAAVHDRDRSTSARVTANPFDPNNPVAVEDYPQPAPPIKPSSEPDAPAPADTRP